MPRFSTIAIATAILWALGYSLWLTNFVFEPMPFQFEHSLRGIPVFVLGASLSLLIARVLGGMQGRTGARVMTAAVVAGIAATIVVVFFDILVMRVIVPRWGGPTWRNILQQLPMAWMYVAWTLLYFALVADAARRDREIRLAQATSAALNAQHRLLVQQLNPHFLFNALNTVYALVVEGDDTRAQRCLLSLSAFLRGSIDRNAPNVVPLSGELASVRHYLEIELTRFGERLHLDVSVPSDLHDRIVPALILQPLVENCIKHGLNGRADPMTIWLSASLEGGELVLSVENDGRSPPENDVPISGVGLNNVRERLQLMYGAAARLAAQPRPGGGFVARVHLPS